MSLLGRAAWWMPRGLGRWIPHLSIEGEEFFAGRNKVEASNALTVGVEAAFNASDMFTGPDLPTGTQESEHPCSEPVIIRRVSTRRSR